MTIETIKKLEKLAEMSRQRNLENKSQERKSNKVVKLPSCKESERTIPNIIARSALFGVIKRGSRSYKEKELIASRDDVEIYYTGKTLDQADCTVWMQALACASVLGQRISINRSKFLKLLGKTTGKKDYQWLNDSLHRLMTGVVTVKTKKYNLEFHLIDLWGEFKDEDTPVEYLLSVNPEVVKMWTNSEYTRVEWQKRLAIKKGGDLASWMQLYIRSNINSNKPQHISLDKLQIWCGSSNMRLRQYRSAMLKALQELTRIGEIKNASIRDKDDMVIFSRTTCLGDFDNKKINYKDRDNHAPEQNIIKNDRDNYAPNDRDNYAPNDRDEKLFEQNIIKNDRDNYAPNDRDNYAPNDRDNYAPNDRDSNALDRDSNALDRDSNALDRDSNAGWSRKLLKLNKFFRDFFP